MLFSVYVFYIAVLVGSGQAYKKRYIDPLGDVRNKSLDENVTVNSTVTGANINGTIPEDSANTSARSFNYLYHRPQSPPQESSDPSPPSLVEPLVGDSTAQESSRRRLPSRPVPSTDLSPPSELKTPVDDSTAQENSSANINDTIPEDSANTSARSFNYLWHRPQSPPQELLNSPSPVVVQTPEANPPTQESGRRRLPSRSAPSPDLTPPAVVLTQVVQPPEDSHTAQENENQRVSSRTAPSSDPSPPSLVESLVGDSTAQESSRRRLPSRPAPSTDLSPPSEIQTPVDDSTAQENSRRRLPSRSTPSIALSPPEQVQTPVASSPAPDNEKRRLPSRSGSSLSQNSGSSSDGSLSNGNVPESEPTNRGVNTLSVSTRMDNYPYPSSPNPGPNSSKCDVLSAWADKVPLSCYDQKKLKDYCTANFDSLQERSFLDVKTSEVKKPKIKKYYIDSSIKANWFQAITLCKSLNMSLASVDSQDDQAVLSDTLDQTGGVVNAWLSGNDLGEQNNYFWLTTGHSITWTNWLYQEPNHLRAGNDTEHCVEVVNKGWKWNDNQCNNPENFICQYYTDK